MPHRYDDVLLECKELEKSMEKTRHNMHRFNAILAANDDSKAALAGAASNLEHQALEELKVAHAYAGGVMAICVFLECGTPNLIDRICRHKPVGNIEHCVSNSNCDMRFVATSLRSRVDCCLPQL